MGNTKSWSTFFPPTHDLFVTVHSGAGAMASLPPKLSPFSLVDGRKALIFSVSILLASLLISGLEVGSGEDGGDELFREILRDEAVSRINQLGKISDADGYLERTFLSPGSIRATDLIMSWMQDAGLKTWVDQMGNLHGRTNAINATAETLLIGSHLDTVVDAGKYDGSLGIVCAISALKVLKVKGKLEKLYRPVEVIAFSDEEGVRFQSTFLGSAAIAGILPPTTLQISDKSGITVQDVLRENSFDATDESLARVKYEPRSVWGYVEVHIEQGPVLETLGYPLGVVKGIAGQTRLKVEVSGAQGHAGTVPMLMRQDPMAAAAELVVTVESLCKYPDKFLAYDEHCGFFGKESFAGLVCTVGEISCWPSASNVIPGQVNFTVDIRAIDDEARELVVSEFSNQVYRKCEERMVNCTIEHKHKAEAAHCDSGLSLQLKHATSSALGKMLGDIHSDVPILMSGAGHDAMAMSHLTKVGMLFVRCRGGISHSPEESVLDDDVWAAGLALLHFFDQHAKFRAKAAMIMAVFFSLTAPTGISLGIALSSNYNENSSAAFIVEGIFDAASTGILIYMALIDLFAADFTNPKMQNNGRLQLGTYLALLLGRGLMSIIAKWA